MDQTTIAEQADKIDALRQKIMEQKCNCSSVNRRLQKISPREYPMSTTHVCCPKCCFCQWDKIEDQIEQDWLDAGRA